MSLTIPNLSVPLVNKLGIIAQQTWISFFQQFVQQPSAALSQSAAGTYTTKEPGSLSIHGATGITFTRGSVTVTINSDFIPVEIGDVVSWTGGATVVFFPRY